MLNFPVSSDKAFILLSLDLGWVAWDDFKIYPDHFHHKFAADDFLIEIYSHGIRFRTFFLGVKLVVCDRVKPNYLGFIGSLVGTTVRASLSYSDEAGPNITCDIQLYEILVLHSKAHVVLLIDVNSPSKLVDFSGLGSKNKQQDYKENPNFHNIN